MSQEAISLHFSQGKIHLSAKNLQAHPKLKPWLHPSKEGAWCLALHYRALVRYLMQNRIPFYDQARAYTEIEEPVKGGLALFPHQAEAFSAWAKGKRGQVELPTGSGKTRLALHAMAAVKRATLVIVPTLDLLRQWEGLIKKEWASPVGLWGGGERHTASITVSTYASALRQAPNEGNRFGLVIFDECHHLAAATTATLAFALIAPYRLGLSATLPLEAERQTLLTETCGPVVFRKEIGALARTYLAPYTVYQVEVPLSPKERQAYTEARACWQNFLAEKQIQLGTPGAWGRWVWLAGKSPEGRAALRAYRRQRKIVLAAENKILHCAALLRQHCGERVLIFTHDNATALALSQAFLVPLITHRTPSSERKTILSHFKTGKWPILVTSRVLNEGVDVPAAGIAIILSGSSSVREHVQRLGRILRPQHNKQALLYELLAKDTTEKLTSHKRRQHHAYR